MYLCMWEFTDNHFFMLYIYFFNVLFREKPLVLYVFSEQDTVHKLFMRSTTSGGSCINDTMLHLAGIENIQTVVVVVID